MSTPSPGAAQRLRPRDVALVELVSGSARCRARSRSRTRQRTSTPVGRERLRQPAADEAGRPCHKCFHQARHSGILRRVISRARAAVLLALPALAACNGSDDDSPMAVTEPAAAGEPTPGHEGAARPSPDLGGRRVGHVLRADLRHGAARRSPAAVRRRAAGHDPRRPPRAEARPAVPRHPRPRPGGRRARAPLDGVRAELPQEPALLRLLHGRRRRHPRGRVQGTPEPGAEAQRAVGARRRTTARTATTTAASSSSAPTASSTSARATAAAAAIRSGPARASAPTWGRSSGSSPSGKPRIPRSNPFRGRGGARPAVYSYGLRNPWRFSFDRKTGDLVIADVGQNEWEEVSFVRRGRGRGANFGWSAFEGNHEYDGGSAPGHVRPVIEHSHGGDGFCSITGGYVLRHRSYGNLRGTYVYGDLCEGVVRGARLGPGPRDRPPALQRAGVEPVEFRRGRPRARLRRVARRPRLPPGSARVELPRHRRHRLVELGQRVEDRLPAAAVVDEALLVPARPRRRAAALPIGA